MGRESFEFKSETKKVLDLVTHSLYSNRDIFLRELISNSSDAIDKARFELIQGGMGLKEGEDWKIQIGVDKVEGCLVLKDNGIGMDEWDLKENLGTIAKSGTEKFLELLEESTKKGGMDLIGKFGVGFYSGFMVSKRIEVRTRKMGGEGWVWQSIGDGRYEIEKIEEKELSFDRGTEIRLVLKEDAKEYLSEEKIKELVRNYSNYIEFPIVMEVEKEGSLKDVHGKKIKTKEEEVLNIQKAIWLRRKEEVKDEEYQKFYQHINHGFEEAVKWVHYRVEGATEFSSILYIPSRKGVNMYFKDVAKNNVHLYARRVFIMKESEDLLPSYMRFVSGVVDSSDLPLNISRENLQEQRILKTIRKSLVKKVFTMLKELKRDEKDKYQTFYGDFSGLLKEGVYEDMEGRSELLDLLMYSSTKTTGGELVGLKEYVDRMVGGQKHIYYISGEEEEVVRKSAHLEVLKDLGYEVLYFLEPMDEIMLQGLSEYKGKVFKSILKGDLGLEGGLMKEEREKEYRKFNEHVKEVLGDRVKEVRISERLKDSPCCLVGEEGDVSEYMAKIMKAYQKEVLKPKRILEINPGHGLLKEMLRMYECGTGKNEEKEEKKKLKDYIELLYGQAVILGTGKLEGGGLEFVDRMNQLILGEKE